VSVETTDLEDLERLGTHLYAQLLSVHKRAKALPYDNVDRWRLSVKAGELARELHAVINKLAGIASQISQVSQ
jgi:hypothetical protein